LSPAPLDLSGRVAIVTGGTRGVGRGITARLLEAGCRVVACGRTPPERPVAEGANEALFVQADVREVEQIDRVIAAARERFGRLDLLVNNAGGAPSVAAATASPRFSEGIIRLNLLAPLLFAQRANSVMQEQPEGGSIVFITSVSGLRPSPGTAAYGAAKAGLVSLAGSLAVEWAPKVRTNCVAAGLVRTELSHLHYGDEQGLARVSATIPLGRMASPRDIGDACLFLASPLASYVSGSTLLVHGGGERPAYLGAAQRE